MDYPRDRPYYQQYQPNDQSRRRRRDEEEIDYRRVRPRPETRDPLKEDYLLELREYAIWLRERQRNRVFEMDEIDTRYDQYKQSFMKNQNEKFYKLHSQVEWFRERYHPIESLKFKKQLFDRKQELNQKFQSALKEGRFDGVLFDDTSDHLKINGTLKKPEGHEDFMEYRYVGLELEKLPNLFVNGINDTCLRKDLDKVYSY